MARKGNATNRPVTQGFSPDAGKENKRGRGHFSPSIQDVFLEILNQQLKMSVSTYLLREFSMI
jgi:hypothetical protein